MNLHGMTDAQIEARRERHRVHAQEIRDKIVDSLIEEFITRKHQCTIPAATAPHLETTAVTNVFDWRGP